MNYYNENDPKAAAWLRELIKEGQIAEGTIDERSICDVRSSDLRDYIQCHFFAGIGGWSQALRLAGWPDDKPVWTGSCPCQPFSAAGNRKGISDKRHLWPEFFRLIAESNPVRIFGEQVASKDGLLWLDGVLSDLEGKDYAGWASDLCSAGVGSPNIRQRLYWVGYAKSERLPGRSDNGDEGRRECPFGSTSEVDRLGYADIARPQGFGERRDCPDERVAGETSMVDRMADADLSGCDRRARGGEQSVCDQNQKLNRVGESDGPRRNEGEPSRETAGHGCPVEPASDLAGVEHSEGDRRLERRPESSGGCIASGRSLGAWADFDIIECTDGKARRTQPNLCRVVDGIPESLGQVCRESVFKLQEEINNYANAAKIDARKTMFNVWEKVRSETIRRTVAGCARFHEETILFSFLFQLAKQGWAFSSCVQCTGAETEKAALRILRDSKETACPPCERGLEEQSPGQPSDPMCVLSSILARYAQEAWSETIRTNAKNCSPLAIGVKGRIMKLRGYGNAINPYLAAEFVQACG